MPNDKRREEVRKIILSCVLSRPGATKITVLDRDYYDAEGERIPWREFGYADIVEFLKSMPEDFAVEWCNGGHQVRGFPSEKTKHVSSLVSRQKCTSKKLYIAPKFRRPFVSRHTPQMQRMRIPADQLSTFVKHVKNNPNGVTQRSAWLMMQKLLPHSTFSIHDMQNQLRELSHSLYLDGNMIYPTPVKNEVFQEVKNYPQSSTFKPQNVPRSPAMGAVYVGGDEGSDFIDFSDEDNFVPVDYANSNYPKQPKTSERLAASFAWNANNEQNAMFNYNDDVEIDEYFAANNDADTKTAADYIDVASLISDRTKSRLDQLMREHPDGIWCADLPEKYLKAYNVHLNYNELGFTSVREYASYLPNIFYMTRANSTDDFILYSADKRPIPDQESASTEPIETRPNSREQYDEHNTVRTQSSDDDDNAPIPADVPPTITQTFAPDDVMNYNDSVDQILVTDLQRDRKYLEVYIVEMFHPTFFWIHLRENKRRFDVFMDDLDTFYNNNKDKYTIPKIALKKGLNCACTYSNSWHRGIIKSVKPDFRVTVMFYDYGTLKTYAAEDVYYLHKEFSFLPAQAIPCGLYNVRPCVGDRWKRSVKEQMIDKINETLLALTIISVDPSNNSMMVILSDTSEEEDVHINDWLVNEKLARCGKMVRMCDNFPYLHYLTCNNITIQSPTKPVAYVEIFDLESDRVNVDEARHDRDQSIPCNKEAYRLFDVKSENIESKTVEALHNVPSSKKVLLQMLRNVNSLDAKSPDAKSQSTNCLKNEKLRGPRKMAKLLEKLKTWNTSNSNSIILAPKLNHDFKDNAQQIDSDTKAIQDNNGDVNYYALNMDFALRDSDNEENNEKDFGTFRSLYGGHGLMEPFDWSVIKKNDDSPHEATVTSRDDMDILIKEYKSNVTEDESESHKLNNLEKELLPANPYFLNITRKEEEYYLPENNIDYDFKNVSQSVARLRNRMEVCNDKYTAVIVTKNVLEILCNNTQSQNTSSPDTNTVKINGVASSITAQTEIINENGEACETKTKQEIEKNGDFDPDMKSVSSNMINNEDCKNQIIRINDKNTFECNTDSSEPNTDSSEPNTDSSEPNTDSSEPNTDSSEPNTDSSEPNTDSSESNTTGKVYNSKYKKLLDQMKRMQMNLMNSSTSLALYNTRDSSNSEQIQLSSCSHSSSTTSSTISSNDEQHEEDFRSQTSVRFTKLCNFTKPASTSSSDFSLDCDFKETRGLLSSENNSVASFNMDDSKQDQSVKIDSIVSNVDDSKQSNATAEMPRTSRMLQLVLKIAENATNDIELDSDDLSNQENVASDTSCDKKEYKSIDKLMVDRVRCKSMSNDINMHKKIFIPPVLNDCDIESDDSDWDCYVEPLIQLRHTDQTEISDNESGRI